MPICLPFCLDPVVYAKDEGPVLLQVVLHYVRCWQSQVSALELRLSPSRMMLIIVREHNLELEGVMDSEGELRWSKDSYVRVLRAEIPFFLEGIVRLLRTSSPCNRLLVGCS